MCIRDRSMVNQCKRSKPLAFPRYQTKLKKLTTVLASMFGIAARKVRRKPGPIDLLVGINYPRFHEGETKVNASLVARRSPIGWVIFGSNAEDVMQEIKQVSLVSLVPPVDSTDFWKTESLGVISITMYLWSFETASARKRRDEDHRRIGQIARQQMDHEIPLEKRPL